jgi:phage terminase large subunit
VYPGETVKVVPKLSIVNGINAVRQLFPRLYFAEGPCADGILGLQHYQYGVNPETKARTKEPLHNWASNPADSLRYYAVDIKEGGKPPKEEPMRLYDSPDAAQAWMS